VKEERRRREFFAKNLERERIRENEIFLAKPT
jgi:hypothetical protein